MAFLNEAGLSHLWTKITDKISTTVSALTADDVGAVSTEKVGVATGVASLDENGKVPVSQLPEYAREIVEGYLVDGVFFSDAEHTQQIAGEKEKIFVDLVSNKCYRWGGSIYIEISPSEQLAAITNGEIDTICS